MAVEKVLTPLVKKGATMAARKVISGIEHLSLKGKSQELLNSILKYNPKLEDVDLDFKNVVEGSYKIKNYKDYEQWATTAANTLTGKEANLKQNYQDDIDDLATGFPSDHPGIGRDVQTILGDIGPDQATINPVKLGSQVASYSLNKKFPFLDTRFVGNAQDNFPATINQYVNYLVRKEDPVFPTEIPNTEEGLKLMRDDLSKQLNRLSSNHTTLLQIIRRLPDSKREIIPSIEFMKDTIRNNKSIVEELKYKSTPTWLNPLNINIPGHPPDYTPQVMLDDSAAIVANYDKTKELLQKVENKLKKEFPTKKQLEYDQHQYRLQQKEKIVLDDYQNLIDDTKKFRMDSALSKPFKDIFGYQSNTPIQKAAFEAVRPFIKLNQYNYQLTPREATAKVIRDLSDNPPFKNLIMNKAEEFAPSYAKQFEHKEEILSEKDIREGLEDLGPLYGRTHPAIAQFAHLFEIANTIKADPKSPLLGLAGSGDVVQLQPYIINTVIARSVEAKIRQLKEAGSKIKHYGMKMRKLNDILKKLKTTSIITDPQGIQSIYGAPLAQPLKANMLDKNDFRDLLNILNTKDFKKIIDHVISTKSVKNLEITQFNKGGHVDYGEMKEVAPLLEPGERQTMQIGGKIVETVAKAGAKAGAKYVRKKVLPKVLGHVEKIFPKKLTGPKEPPKTPETKEPWSVMDREGLQSKEFKTQKEAEDWLYKTKEEAPEPKYYEEVIDYTVGKYKPKLDIDPKSETGVPAMLWKTPTIIKNAPIEIGQGIQWLGLLRKAGVSPKELSDSSMGNFLQYHAPNKKFTKEELLKEFDEVAPKFEVTPFGKIDSVNIFRQTKTKFDQMVKDLYPFSLDQIKAIGDFKKVLNNIEKTINRAGSDKAFITEQHQIKKHAASLNNVMKEHYGIDDFLTNKGVLTNREVPAPIRSVLGNLQELLRIRGAGHKMESTPKHAGQQTLPGGVNYREFVFRYTPGKLRLEEPTYTPGHTFDLGERARGVFVHTRISDRTDNFGRKILFVEEIQSDMHQGPQGSIRRAIKRKQPPPDVYAPRGDVVTPGKAEINKLTLEAARLQGKIDETLMANPADPNLPSLYRQRTELSKKIAEKSELYASKKDNTSRTPEGPFQRSEDYGSFVIKYLLRLAKEGDYDGVAISTGAIKNRLRSEQRGAWGEDEAKGHYGFYDAIMQKAFKKIAKQGNLDYTATSINDGITNWGNIPILLLTKDDKVMKGLPVFKEGGLVRENFVDVIPLL